VGTSRVFGVHPGSDPGEEGRLGLAFEPAAASSLITAAASPRRVTVI
jgi:hypothetical protein